MRDLCGHVFAANCYKAWGIPDEDAFVAGQVEKLESALAGFKC